MNPLIKNNNYQLSDCDLSIGVIPILSLSKLFVGVMPEDGFSFNGVLIGVILLMSLSNVWTGVCSGGKFLACPLNHPFCPPKFPVAFNCASSSLVSWQVVTNWPVDFLKTAIRRVFKS